MSLTTISSCCFECWYSTDLYHGSFFSTSKTRPNSSAYSRVYCWVSERFPDETRSYAPATQKALDSHGIFTCVPDDETSLRRRTLLSGLGVLSTASFAGCISFPAPSWSDDAPPADTVSLNAQDTPPDEVGIGLDVEVVRAEYSDHSPAIIRITTTNDGDPVRLSHAERCPLFRKSQGGSDDPAGLWLNDPRREEYIDRKEGRWVADQPSDAPRGYANDACLGATLERGASLSSTYQVWDDYKTRGYLVPGTYRWRTSVHFSRNLEAERLEDSFPWSFSLTLEG